MFFACYFNRLQLQLPRQRPPLNCLVRSWTQPASAVICLTGTWVSISTILSALVPFRTFFMCVYLYFFCFSTTRSKISLLLIFQLRTQQRYTKESFIGSDSHAVRGGKRVCAFTPGFVQQRALSSRFHRHIPTILRRGKW